VTTRDLLRAATGVLLVLLTGAAAPAAAQQPDCAPCHLAQTSAAVRRHEPLGCQTCHDLSARDSAPAGDSVTTAGDTVPRPPHPPRPPLQAGSALCTMCHSGGVIDAALRHVPDSLGACTACHDPHGSSTEAMLRRAGTDLCLGCHRALRDSVRLSRVTHGALRTADGCLGCHDPHAEGRSTLLRADQPAMCLSCHERTYVTARRRVRDVGREIREATTVHFPVEAGPCTFCHAPHASRRDRLLTDGFEVRVYADFNPRSYGLCLQCHASIADTAATAETGFRNGAVNLHALHVREPGRNRSCYTCHAVHGAANPALVRASVPFGSWMLPLGFVPGTNGGRCAPGCHTATTYTPGPPPATGGPVREERR